MNNTALAPSPGYNKKGRGFPDVSLQGFNYLTTTGLDRYLSSGSSASTPLMAGMISNLNAARMKLGKGSVGFINPALYAYSSNFTTDIIPGSVQHTVSGANCSQGFHATPGWDPASGLGSLNYGEMEVVFKSLGTEANGA